MTTSPVVTITDELVAELDDLAYCGPESFPFSASVLQALLCERAAMQSQIKAGIVTQDNLELYRKDAERLDKLDRHGIAYGFEDIHEGNSWDISGPFSTVRDAIDAIPDDQAMQEQQP